MGERGFPPVPTRILELRGSKLVKERQKQGEPMPEKGVPEVPDSLAGTALKMWETITEMLDEMGVLSRIDGGQLERYCIMFVQWRQLQRIIAKFSVSDDTLAATIQSDSSRAIIRNAWAETHRIDQALKQIEMQFGLTPSARARLSCLVVGDRKTTDKDDLDALFFGSKG